MAVKNNGLPIPAIIDDGNRVCVVFEIPDQIEYRAAVVGQIKALATWKIWERGEIKQDTRAAQVSQLFKQTAYETLCFGDDLMSCCGGSSRLERCICDLTALIRTQVNIDIQNELPVIPPDNPGQNLPGLNPAPGIDQQRYESSLCDSAKLAIEGCFEAVYQAQIQSCDGQEVDWLSIGQLTSTALFAGALVYPPAAIALYAAGITAAALSIGAEVEGYQPFKDDVCPPERVPVEFSRIYGCQLWENLRNGITYSNVQSAFVCKNTVAIDWYQNNVDPDIIAAEQADADTREILSGFVRQQDFYQSLMTSINALAENPYQGTSVCDDCVDPTGPNIDIIEWGDPRIISIDPPPTSQQSASRWTWDGVPEITITFDKLYYLVSFDAELLRAAAVGQPNQVCIQAGQKYCDGSGGTGSGNINININEAVATITLSPNTTSQPLSLDIGTFNKRIRVRELLSYNDCS